MYKLKQQLASECKQPISGEILDILFAKAVEIKARPKEVIIRIGEVNTNIYIVKSGILAGTYIDGDRQKTFGFASSGTIMLSPHSYCMGQSSFISLESCTESTLLKISKKDFDKILDESHEFALWMYNMCMSQIYVFEKKLSLINGTAKDRYVSMFRNRPEIINSVPMKHIASYLDVTPSYLCRIRRELMKEK